jgi:hypothetical protein
MCAASMLTKQARQDTSKSGEEKEIKSWCSLHLKPREHTAQLANLIAR